MEKREERDMFVSAKGGDTFLGALTYYGVRQAGGGVRKYRGLEGITSSPFTFPFQMWYTHQGTRGSRFAQGKPRGGVGG